MCPPAQRPAATISPPRRCHRRSRPPDPLPTRRSAEACYIDLVTSGTIGILDLTADDWTRVAELVDTYLDRPLGVIDAAIVALAERHHVIELASMNGRDFYLVRPRHTPAFTLLPAGLARP